MRGRFGDLLIGSGSYDRVILCPIAVGGTSMEDWAPGGANHPRLVFALSRVAREGLALDAMLWHQGESDSRRPERDGTWYEERFAAMLAAIRGIGIEAPLFVARSTICGAGMPPGSEAIRTAQKRLAETLPGVFPGPDTDALGPEFRHDDCHFNEAGLQRVAEMWFESLSADDRH